MSDRRLLTQAEARRVLRRVGHADEFINEVLRELPDPIDLDREQVVLESRGLTRESLVDRMGGSP
jgi:hypothetical protein